MGDRFLHTCHPHSGQSCPSLTFLTSQACSRRGGRRTGQTAGAAMSTGLSQGRSGSEETLRPVALSSKPSPAGGSGWGPGAVGSRDSRARLPALLL